MFRKLIIAAILLPILMSAAAGCEKSETAATSTSLDLISEKGVLVAGLDDTFAPMGYRNEQNELVGFDIELGAELARRLGVDIEWQSTQWDGVILALNSKRFDIILSGMTITAERQEAIAFSLPYIGDGLVMAVRKGTSGFNNSGDLLGQTVGTQAGSSGEAALQKIDGIAEIKLYLTYPDAFTDLQIGRIPVVVADAITAGFYMSKRPDIFEVTGEKLTREPLAIGLRKEDTALREAIDEALRAMRDEGTLAALSMKWFGRDISWN